MRALTTSPGAADLGLGGHGGVVPEPADAPRHDVGDVPVRRTRRLGRLATWRAVGAIAAGVAVGSFAGQVWGPLGVGAAALVGGLLGGVVEGLVAAFGAAIGVPVLSGVVRALLHSPVYLPAVAIGLLAGITGRHWLRRRLSG
ncbi:MAG: hypothetical protein M0010_03890 [Actinomycetota bacterium]|nr:hypothetical protein [Actinomycetota bacterium]